MGGDGCNTAKRTGRALAFAAAAYTLFVLLAVSNLPTPFYHLYQAHLGASPLAIALVFSVYAAALIPTLALAGPLSDGLGRRRVLLPACLLAIAGLAAFAAADSVGHLILARVTQGIAVGAAAGPLTAALVELEPGGNRPRAALVSTAASLGGLAAGPLLSGVLAHGATEPPAAPFLAGFVLLLPAAVAAALLPDGRRATGPTGRRTLRLAQIPRPAKSAFALSGASVFLAFAAAGLFLSLVPGYLLAALGSSDLRVAAAAPSLMLACSLGAQLPLRAKPPLGLQSAGLALLAVGLGLLALGGVEPSLTLLLAASALAGGGHGLTFLGSLTEVARSAPPDRRAETLSLFYVLVYLGFGLPTVGVGLLAAQLGLPIAVQLFAGAVAAASLVQIGLLRRARRRRSAAPDAGETAERPARPSRRR